MGYAANRRRELNIGTVASYSQRRRRELQSGQTGITQTVSPTYVPTKNVPETSRLSITPEEYEKLSFLEKMSVNVPQELWDKMPWYEKLFKLRPKTEEELRKEAEAIKKLRESAVGAFTLKGIDSATLGAADRLSQEAAKRDDYIGKQAKEFIAQKQEGIEKHPVAATSGEIAGYILPGSAATKGISVVGKPLLNKIGSNALRKVVEGGLAGGAMEAAEGTIRGESVGDVAKRTAVGLTLGAAGDAALYGIGKGFKALRNAVRKPVEELAVSAENIVFEPIIKPTTRSGTFRLKNKALEDAVNEYNEAIETIQNHFRTNELRADEIPLIKSELGIDLDDIINRMEAAEKGVQLPGTEAMRLKRASGVASDRAYSIGGKTAKQASDELRAKTSPAKSDKGETILSETVTPHKTVRELTGIRKEIADYYGLKDKDIATLDEKDWRDITVDYNRTKTKWEVEHPGKPMPKSGKTTPEYDVEYRKSLPKDEEGLRKIIKSLEEQAAITTDEKELRRINLQLFAARDELKKLSQFRTNTIERSTMLTEEEKGFLPDEDFEYTPQESKAWESTAKLNVRNDPEFSKQQIMKARQLDKVQEYEAAIISKQLLDKARQTGDYKELSKWLSAVSAKTRESARALKAVDLAWDKASPEAGIKRAQKIIDGVEDAIAKKNPGKIKKIDEGVAKIKAIVDDDTLSPQQVVNKIREIIGPKHKDKMTFTKLMEIINKGKSEGDIDYDAVRNLLKEKEKIPTLSNDEIAEIDRLYQKANEYEPESYEFRMYTEKARKLVEDKIPTDIVDKYRALQRLSMIFNPKTLITRNPGGNILLMSVTQIKENTLGAFVDMLVSAIRGSERTTVFAPIEKAKTTAKGFVKGVKEWGKDIKYNVDTNPTHGQLELQKGKMFDTSHSGKITKYLNPVNRILNVLDTIEKRLLQLGDRPFYEAAYASRIAELKKIKKVTDVTDEMMIDAKAYALDKVFQRDSELAKIFSRVKNASDNVGFKILANTVMPFTQTPANVLDKMIEYSPGGIIKAIRELAFPKNGVFNQKYFVDNLSSGLTGTGMLVLGYIMMAKNILIITKASPSSKERRFEQAEGKSNYALKFGDSYYTIDWAQPVASILLAGAEMYKGGQRGDDAFRKVLNSLTEGGATFFNMSLLKNVSSLFGSGTNPNPAASLIKTLLGSTTQFTPTAGKQIAQLIDPYVRETYDPNLLKEQINVIKSRLPGLSMTLPVKRDAMGKEIKAYQGRNNLLNVMLNPGFYTKESDDPAIKEIRRLFDIEKDTDLLPGKEALTTGKFRYNQKDYTMSAKEFEQFNKTYGDILQNGFTSNGIKYPGINTLINTPVYKKLNDKGKASRIKGIYDKAYEMAKREFLKKRGIK